MRVKLQSMRDRAFASSVNGTSLMRGALALAVAGAAVSAGAADLIPKITHAEVLQHLATDKKVVFVDAREADEWAEERLPGAIKLPLRAAVSPDELRSVPKDAVLVAYCIKDFRGYEVARALHRAGYSVRVMNDPGLQGWKRAALPTAGDVPRAGDHQAEQALLTRAKR